MTNRLAGKVAIVTGATSGIGKATALLMASEGAKVVVAGLTTESAEETVHEIQEAGGEAIAIQADVSQPDQVKSMVDTAVERFGQVDVAFNNAGISGPTATTADYDPEAWNMVIAVNLTGVFLCMKYQLEQMLKQGSGSIINCSSILGTVGFESSSAYVAAKHGVIGLTRTAALENARKGIRVNAVCPGFIDTAMIDSSASQAEMDFKAALAEMEPMGRLGTSEEVAESVVWLASDAASFVTGTSLFVDGGYVAQ